MHQGRRKEALDHLDNRPRFGWIKTNVVFSGTDPGNSEREREGPPHKGNKRRWKKVSDIEKTGFF